MGLVDSYADPWLGIEWDDPSRGKHDGATGGKRYFSCAATAPAPGTVAPAPAFAPASFVRPHKAQLGISLAAAIIERYAGSSADDGAPPTPAAMPASPAAPPLYYYL